MQKAKHDFKCDNCGEIATINIQEWYNQYEIDNSGNFKEVDDWEGNSNEFYCNKCHEEGLK